MEETPIFSLQASPGPLPSLCPRLRSTNGLDLLLQDLQLSTFLSVFETQEWEVMPMFPIPWPYS